MAFAWEHSVADLIDWANPINWSHPLARGLVSFWMAVPGYVGFGSSRWRDLTREHPMTLQGMTPATAWRTNEGRAGAWGSLAFDDAASNYADYASAIISDTPLTIASWFNSDDATALQTIFSVEVSGVTNNRFELRVVGNTAGDPIHAYARATANTQAATTTGYTAGQWHHACGVYTSATDRAAFIDGGSKGTDATSQAPTGMNTTTIGRATLGTPGRYFSGKIGDVMLYNRPLSDSEVWLLCQLGKQHYAGLLNLQPMTNYASEQAAAAEIARRLALLGVGV